MLGSTIGRYRVLEKIGEGGMGVVYKAQDTLLGRLVALKFLSAHQQASRARFMREAKAASALDDPNICTIHGFETAPDGRLFMVMPYYEAETLKAKIARGPLSIAEAIDIAVQVAHGLSKAHAKGIVHRDIKPANLIVNPEGLVKILDFGVAKLAGDESLSTGEHRIGTLAYMSPEQVCGHPVDHRTDLWSLGVVGYEMLAGRRPFEFDSPEPLAAAIVDRAPAPLAAVRKDAPQELIAAINRLMAKSPAARHQTAELLASELKDIRHHSGFASAGLEAIPAALPSIAVLPFSNVGNDAESEFFSDGLTDELTSALAQLDGLRVVSRTSAFEFKGKPADARTIGSRLNVTRLLEGSVRRAGERIRVTVQLVNAADGYQLWSERYDRQISDVFAIQEDIARSVTGKLMVRLHGWESRPLTPRRTASMAAYNDYLRGRYNWFKNSEEGLQKAAEYFGRAVEQDPEFAAAWSGLADYYFSLGFWGICPPTQVWPEARQLAQKALSLDERLAEVHISLGYLALLCDWDRATAEREFQRAIGLNPSHSNAHFASAIHLTQSARLEAALAAMRRAQELDPLSFTIGTGTAWVLYYLGRYDDAITECRRVLEVQPGYFEAHACIGMALERKGEVGDAVRSLERAAELPGGDAFAFGLLAWLSGVHGMGDEALNALERLRGVAESRYVPPGAFVLAHLALNDRDALAASLDQAFAEHDPLLCYVDVFPPFAPLRSDSRFRSITHAGTETETLGRSVNREQEQ